jgi:radical SAM superfamily enzyme YgiQ (UPF0313 family)
MPSCEKILAKIVHLLKRNRKNWPISEKNNDYSLNHFFEPINEQIQLYIFQRRYKEAIQEITKMLGKDPSNIFLLFHLGNLHHRNNAPNETKIFFDLARKQIPEQSEIIQYFELYNQLVSFLPNSRTDVHNLYNPDIILIQAPGWGVNTPPMATATLTSYLRKYNYIVFPIDLNIELYRKSPPHFKEKWDLSQSHYWNMPEFIDQFSRYFNDEIEKIIDLIISTNTKIIGFTIYESSELISLYLARMIKHRRPEITIVFGGPQVSRFMKGMQIIENDDVDVVVQGEGELTLNEIIKYLKYGDSLINCPGVLIKSDNIVYDTGDRVSIKNLNELPPPDFLDYTFEIYREPNRLPVISSRSCPNKCIFCNERPFWREYRNRSAENVFQEIKIQLIRYPFINFIDFQDSLVNGKIRELELLADLIIENGLKFEWSGQAIIRKEMTFELIQKLKLSGCVCLAYGLETPSEQLMLKIGKVMSRGVDVDAIVQAHGEVGLGLVFNFMFGLPGETEEDAFETLEFLRRNKNFISTVNPSPGFCLLSPGTLVYDNPQKYGVDISKGGMYWESIDRLNTYPVRLNRYENFCRLVQELKITTIYPNTIFIARNLTLGTYYSQIGDKKRAQRYFKAWIEEHPEDKSIQNALERVQTEN